MTELDAVNVMLSSISEAPTSSLESTAATVDISLCRQILKEVNLTFQGRGWHFNTEQNYELHPDVDGLITVGTDVVRIDVDPSLYDARDIVLRGTRLYDRTNHTYVFTQSIDVEMVTLLDWDSLPEPARRFIAIKAARIFQARIQGSESAHGLSAQEEFEAWTAFLNYECLTADPNIFDNYDVGGILDR